MHRVFGLLIGVGLKMTIEKLNLPYFRLFVLGAGFSRPAGLPLAKDMLEIVRSNLRTVDANNQLERDISEWRDLYPGQPIDLERVLAYSHRRHHLRLLGSDETYEHASLSIYAVQKEIQRILIESTPSDGAIPIVYRDFVERLTQHDVVLTFNYDTLLEQTLEFVSKPYSLVPEWWLDKKSSEHESKYVDILKLHGSVDWYDRYFYDARRRWHAALGIHVPDRDPIFGPTPSVPSQPLVDKPLVGRLGPEADTTLLSRVFRVPDLRKYFPLEDGPYTCVVPFILPPAYDKLLGYDSIVDLWDSLHRTLDSFSSITIIGYSMPQYDSYAYEALGRLLFDYQLRSAVTYFGQRRVPVQLITKAKSKRSALKDIPFLKPNRTRVWHQGFSSSSIGWMDWGDNPG